MKKGRKIAMGLFSSLFAASMIACGKEAEMTEISGTSAAPVSETCLSEQLFSLDVTSEEEAKELAKQYGIEFVSYGLGVATFSTTEDPQEVIDRGAKEGYTPLYLNNDVTID